LAAIRDSTLNENRSVTLAPGSGGKAMSSNAPDADWSRIEELFPDLLALPPDERAAYLERVCGGDAGLRSELESLLRAAGEASTLDAPPVMKHAEGVLRSADSGSTPERLGVWRIVRLLGRGGMGEVYLAEREGAGFRQLGAAKILRPEAAAHAQRFEAERRILAQLEHPDIARLLDGGVTDAGRPYMVMEYVDGVSLTEYCAQRKLGLDERIALFERICRAVAYAHAHLVVHRDLKHGNILVTTDGHPKLLDFGIAKLVEESAGTETTHTALFTPDHAAPEQLQGAPATTAVDIYALGVMFYELLTGVRPWSAGATPLSRVVEKLMQEEPKPASVSAATQADAPVEAQQLRGDLDAIIAKCLRKAPQSRYATAEALLRDLAHWRAHLPVAARGDARGYVARRWLRRHRLPVAAGALVLGAMLAGLSVALWQAGVARAHAHDAEEAAKTARAQTQRAEQVKDFLFATFREQDPFSRDRDRPREPGELIQAAARNLDEGSIDDPALRSELLDDLGEIAISLGDINGAEPLLQRALAETEARLGENSLESVETLRNLARLRLDQERTDEAVRLAEQALAILTRHEVSNSLQAAHVKEFLGFTLAYGKSAPQRAFELIAEARAIFEMRLGADHPLSVHALRYQAEMLSQARREEDAKPLLLDAIARIERSRGGNSYHLVGPLDSLGLIQRRAGESTAAAASHLRAAELATRGYGERHHSAARAYRHLAEVYAQTHRYADAVAALDKAALGIGRGKSNDYTELLKERGQLHLLMEKPVEGERDLREAYEELRAKLGEQNGFTWFYASEWGQGLAALGRLDEAERVQRRALSRLGEIMGKDAYQIVLICDALAATLEKSGRYAEALELRRRSLEITEKRYSTTHRLWAVRTQRLARALMGIRTPRARAEAASLLESALALYRTSLAGDPNYPEALVLHAQLRRAAGDRAAARLALEEAVMLLERDRGAEHPMSRQARAELRRL
jgi:eukaryotic-like serine/threonine-protein kinase